MKFAIISMLCVCSFTYSAEAQQSSQSPFQTIINAFKSAPANSTHFQAVHYLDGMYGGYCAYPNGRVEESVLATVFEQSVGPAFPGQSKYFISERNFFNKNLLYSAADRVLKSYNPVVFQYGAAVSVGNPTPAWFGMARPLTGTLFLKYSSTFMAGKTVAVVLETEYIRGGSSNPPVVRACYFYNKLRVF